MKKASIFVFALLMFLVPSGQMVMYAEPNKEKDFITSANAHGITINDYVGTSKDVIIPETIGGQLVTSIGEKAFYSDHLTSVVIPHTVSTIGERAFEINQLTSVVIPETVTTIGDLAFAYNQLTSVVIPDSVSTIGNSTFTNNQLVSVVIPETVMSIGNSAFTNNKLTTVVIPENVSTIGNWAFASNQLTSIVIPNRVSSIGHATFMDNQLTSVVISDSVSSIGAMAFADNRLATVFIPASVLSIGFLAFDGNSSLIITGFDPSEAQDFAYFNDIPFQKLNVVVSFDSNGGNPVAVTQATYGQTIVPPTQPTKDDFSFEGWYIDSVYSLPWSFDTDIVTGDITLYAKWTSSVTTASKVTNKEDPISALTVSFDSRGGSPVLDTIARLNQAIAPPTQPSKSGFSFDGWYIDSALSLPWNFSSDTVSRDITLYAKWVITNSSENSGGSSSFWPSSSHTVTSSQELETGTKPTAEPKPNVESKPKVPTTPLTPIVFKDISTHWARLMIESIAARGLITGYPDATFRPNQPILRKHMAGIISGAFELPILRKATPFADVEPGHPYFESISRLQQIGLIDGFHRSNDSNDLNDFFHPDVALTRAEAAKILVLALDLPLIQTSSFEDVPSSHWAHDYIATLAETRMVLGYHGQFRPEEFLTRAELAALLYRSIPTE
ncbi:leucine-rich repeat protein [Paenibacillus xylanexedens]|uniref:leucine-rich repeat protein n=1 Tax=Paenibacillus xylanexedens TaxID=528191 RepID=UPI0011A809B6|nr:leucine-rich repeat protein [Paenibacillus xylanexedens]